MDALLGAAALGDIGKHFPDSDDNFKNISLSTIFLTIARFLPSPWVTAWGARLQKMFKFEESLKEKYEKELVGMPVYVRREKWRICWNSDKKKGR